MVNPVFLVIIVSVILAVVAFFLLMPAFKPIGKRVSKPMKRYKNEWRKRR